MPEGWVAAFHNLDLPARAIEAAKTAENVVVDSDGVGISEVRCECLGTAKAVDVSDVTCVRLRTASGSERNYLLCARVVGEQALVHPGDFEGETPVHGSTFDPNHLELKDLHADCVSEAPPRKRVRRTKAEKEWAADAEADTGEVLR